VPLDWSAFGVDLHLDASERARGGRRDGLERALRNAIRDGRLTAGSRLPSTRALAAELGLARGTVSAAYDQLIAEGYLSARTGSGTTVSRVPTPATAADAAADATTTITPEPRYNLRPGSPDVSAFPVSTWLRAARRALTTAPTTAFGHPDPLGRVELREALAEYLGRARGVLTDPDRIMITSGYGQALALIAQAIAAGGPAVVAMEDPGLSPYREVVSRQGVRVIALPVDERGARTDLLSTVADIRAVFVTPAHQYPLGMTMRPDRRRAAIAWAERHGGLIVEDDYDGEFRYDRQPVGALQGTAPEHVIYAGTSSKTLAPGLRLAWLALPERLVDPMIELKQRVDMRTETLGQLTLAELIRSHGYDRHVRAGRLRYRRRRDLLVERLGRGPFEVTGIAAGLHATIRLPSSGPGEAALLDRAAAAGLMVESLGTHWHAGPGPLRNPDRPQALIVGYGTPPESAYPAALDILARVLRGAARGGQ
jgi:GntR family transcriptional regulator/MocR family aminotransferase